MRIKDIYQYTAGERFLRYVQIDTQSDPLSSSFPSTEKQKDLSRLLVEELKQSGVKDAHLDEWGYVYATIPSATKKKVPVICFCAHVDTAPDCSGTDVKPLVHKNFDGSPIKLPDDEAQVINTSDHPYLLEKVGDDIVTASGKTLLGADNKAGVAIIMDFVNYIMLHPDTPHGTIRILFTPDEEIGRGVDKVDLVKLGANVGYSLDGGELGSYTDETFSADKATINFYGISAHPGYGKNKLVNALKVAGAFLKYLPSNKLSPETTSGRKGFVHPTHVTGNAEKAMVELIVRDFKTSQLPFHEAIINNIAKKAVSFHAGSSYEVDIAEQYRNMKDILIEHPVIEKRAKEAMKKAGVKFKKTFARGGTDGSRLSFMGLPCPDIFTGEMAFHGKHEYISIQDMQRSVDVLVQLVQVWEKHAPM